MILIVDNRINEMYISLCRQSYHTICARTTRDVQNNATIVTTWTICTFRRFITSKSFHFTPNRPLLIVDYVVHITSVRANNAVAKTKRARWSRSNANWLSVRVGYLFRITSGGVGTIRVGTIGGGGRWHGLIPRRKILAGVIALNCKKLCSTLGLWWVVILIFSQGVKNSSNWIGFRQIDNA